MLEKYLCCKACGAVTQSSDYLLWLGSQSAAFRVEAGLSQHLAVSFRECTVRKGEKVSVDCDCIVV